MGPIPFIVGALFLRNRSQRSVVGAGSTAKRTEISEPAPVQTDPKDAPWFNDAKTVIALPRTVKLKQMTPEDLVTLATVSNQIKVLAAERTESGQFKAPVRDPGLEKKFAGLMQLFSSTIRQLEKSPQNDPVYWQKFGALLSVYQHFNGVRLTVGF